MSIALRRREEKEQRRRDILEAAEAVFADGNVERATLEDVARQARLSRSLIYFYFKDREDLYYAVTLRGLRRLRRELLDAVRGRPSGIDKLAAMLRAYTRFAQAEPVHFEALARFAAQGADGEAEGSQRRACVAEGERILRGVAAVIQGGIRDGSIRADTRHPLATAVALWGFVHGLILVLAKRRSADAPFYGVGVEQLTEDAFELMRRAVATEPG